MEKYREIVLQVVKEINFHLKGLKQIRDSLEDRFDAKNITPEVADEIEKMLEEDEEINKISEDNEKLIEELEFD